MPTPRGKMMLKLPEKDFKAAMIKMIQQQL